MCVSFAQNLREFLSRYFALITSGKCKDYTRAYGGAAGGRCGGLQTGHRRPVWTDARRSLTTGRSPALPAADAPSPAVVPCERRHVRAHCGVVRRRHRGRSRAAGDAKRWPPGAPVPSAPSREALSCLRNSRCSVRCVKVCWASTERACNGLAPGATPKLPQHRETGEASDV